MDTGQKELDEYVFVICRGKDCRRPVSFYVCFVPCLDFCLTCVIVVEITCPSSLLSGCLLDPCCHV